MVFWQISPRLSFFGRKVHKEKQKIGYFALHTIAFSGFACNTGEAKQGQFHPCRSLFRQIIVCHTPILHLHSALCIKKRRVSPNIIKLRNKPSSEMSPVLFLKKSKKDLTKNKKCAVEFISELIKSTLVNRKMNSESKEKAL